MKHPKAPDIGAVSWLPGFAHWHPCEPPSGSHLVRMNNVPEQPSIGENIC
jgi:hypothetical protein